MPDSGKQLRLSDAFDTPERKRTYVRRLFSTIADRYDLITVLLSFGRDRGWKRLLVSRSGVQPGARALDLACGTGDIAFELARRGARTVGLDITLRMLQIAASKRDRGATLAFTAGDMASLPFGDGEFDVVTSGYGIRNVPLIEPALQEIRRVLRPGGLFLALDFNRPDNPLIRGIYLSYLTLVGSILGFILHRDPETYRYIPESIRRYPGAARICDLARALGFRKCEWVPILGGLMAIHIAKK